jgi:DNA-binding CsgD family transcriptional regulator
MGTSLLALRARAPAIVRPAPLSEGAVRTIVGAELGDRASKQLYATAWAASRGNPLDLRQLLRSVQSGDGPRGEPDRAQLLAAGREGLTRRMLTRVRKLDPRALSLAQALSVLGDRSELRHAAAIAGVEMADAMRLDAELVGLDVLAGGDPPRFVHPIVRDAIAASLDGDERDAAHRSAARLLHAEGAPSGQVAAHLIGTRPSGDGWVLARLQAAAQAATDSGAPRAAADLLARAMSEPPPPAQRVGLLRATARAEATAGRDSACMRLEEALRLATDQRERAEIALELAETYAALFRWVDSVDVIERALGELAGADERLSARLEGELVVCGLQDGRRASRVAPLLERLSSRPLPAGSAVEPMAVAEGMAMVLAARPAEEAAAPLEEALSQGRERTENWDRRATLLWTLVVAERFDSVASALAPMLEEVRRAGSARGLIATYSTLGLLNLRLGALPEADAAARVALSVLHEGDFAPALVFAATVLADVAIEAGELDEAQALLALLPQEGWPAGVGTVLIPAARGRLRLAEGRPAEALADFQTCAAMFGPEVWGMQLRDVGYVHARAGAAEALLGLGERERARELAQAELADVKLFGTPRALGVALRVAGLAQGEEAGLELLAESVAALRGSPALVERARSLTELGDALRNAGQSSAAREPLAEALDLAARCGARPLAARAREQLDAAGAQPHRGSRSGLEALTPRELRIVRIAAEGRSDREIAQELYVTPRTIEDHLARAYAKLGIEGRDQLPRVLERDDTEVTTP